MFAVLRACLSSVRGQESRNESPVAIPVTARRTSGDTARKTQTVTSLLSRDPPSPLSHPFFLFPSFYLPLRHSARSSPTFSLLPRVQPTSSRARAHETIFVYRWKERRAKARVVAPLLSVRAVLFRFHVAAVRQPLPSSSRYPYRRRRRLPLRCSAARAVYSTRIARASPLAVDARHKEAEDETVEGDRILSYANIG